MRFRLSRDARLVRFPAADGVRLEGRLTPASRDRAVVLCHPHPLHGGSMLTPVIMTAEQAFQEAGWTTLAFNFRGVGASEGSHGEGVSEPADVTGALDWLPEILGAAPSRLAVAGYSFGSWVGGQVAATDPRVGSYVGIAPPLDLRDFAFLRAARCRIALVGAARDQFSRPGTLQALLASLPGSPWSRTIDTDHFFTPALPALATACGDAIRWSERPVGGDP